MSEAALDAAFTEHRRALWALAYRMLGTATDAEDAVQDTFMRAIERPPVDRQRPWKPWLVRVLMNGCRDRLRRRRRRSYPGPWLPSPVSTEAPHELAVASLFAPQAEPPDARIDLLQSVSIAFLVALEVLTAQQRAVLVLRDVCDCTGAQTAELLSMSVANVKVTLHRARRALALADPDLPAPTPNLQEASMAVIARFAAALASGQLDAVRAVVADDAHLLSDGGGVVFASNKPLHGGDVVAAVYHGLAQASGGGITYEVRMFNGLPAVVMHHDEAPPKWPRRGVLTLIPDADGQVARVYSVLAPSKLEGVPNLG